MIRAVGDLHYLFNEPFLAKTAKQTRAHVVSRWIQTLKPGALTYQLPEPTLPNEGSLRFACGRVGDATIYERVADGPICRTCLSTIKLSAT